VGIGVFPVLSKTEWNSRTEIKYQKSNGSTNGGRKHQFFELLVKGEGLSLRRLMVNKVGECRF